MIFTNKPANIGICAYYLWMCACLRGRQRERELNSLCCALSEIPATTKDSSPEYENAVIINSLSSCFKTFIALK